MQSRLFNRVVRLMQSDCLARLAHEGHTNEPVLRRTTVDKTTRRLRQILASVAWNIKYTQWLHNALMDNLPSVYLVSYLDALQVLYFICSSYLTWGQERRCERAHILMKRYQKVYVPYLLHLIFEF